MSTGLEKRTILSWAIEPSDVRAPVRSTEAGAESFTATTIGGAGFDTTISTSLTGATDDFYTGGILRCVGGTSANVGVDVEITRFNAGTDTLTHSLFPARTQVGDQFVIYVPPDPIAVVTTADAAAPEEVTASRRNESDYTPRGGAATDWYGSGDYLVTKLSANISTGAKVAVSSFVAAGGAFTQASGWGVATTVADLFYIRRFPKCWGPPTLTWKEENLPHEAQRGDFGKTQSVQGTKPWSAEVTLPLKGSGTAAGDATYGVAPPELALPLRAALSPAVSRGNTCGAGSTTTVVQVANGTEAYHPIGTVMLFDGRATVVQATAADGANPDDITVSPALHRAPAATEIVYGGYSYEPKLTGHNTMTLDAYVGGVTNVKLYGGLITSMKLTDFARNSVPKIVLGFQGAYFLETPVATPTAFSPTFDTVRPQDAKDCHVILGASTRLILRDATVDFGFASTSEDSFALPGGVYGGRITDMKPVITLTASLDTASPNNTYAELQRYQGGQTFSLMLQHGKERGKVVVFYAHKCAWLSPDHGVTDGLRTLTFTVEVLASDLTTMPDCLLGFC